MSIAPEPAICTAPGAGKSPLWVAGLVIVRPVIEEASARSCRYAALLMRPGLRVSESAMAGVGVVGAASRECASSWWMAPACRRSGSAVGSSARVTGATATTTPAARAGGIVERALDLGVNLVDTAEAYGYGRSERIVGEAIRGRRDAVFLATKLFPLLPIPPVVQQRARGSARRLGVDAIDLYQVHWPNPVVPNAPTMEGMRRVLDEGIVRHTGVSNFARARWEDAERRLGRPVISNQVQYSLVQRKPERELLPYTQRAGRLVIAYSPLAQGLLSGHYDGTNPPRG